MHCICQEAFLYESTRSEPNPMRLFWISNAASSEIVKSKPNLNVRMKYLKGWTQRVQEYGNKMAPLMQQGGGAILREAREIGIIAVESDKNLNEISEGDRLQQA